MKSRSWKIRGKNKRGKVKTRNKRLKGNVKNCFLKSIHQLLISSEHFLVLSKNADPMRLKLNLSMALPNQFPLSLSLLGGTTFSSNQTGNELVTFDILSSPKPCAFCHAPIPAHTATLCSYHVLPSPPTVIWMSITYPHADGEDMAMPSTVTSQ